MGGGVSEPILRYQLVINALIGILSGPIKQCVVCMGGFVFVTIVMLCPDLFA